MRLAVVMWAALSVIVGAAIYVVKVQVQGLEDDLVATRALVADDRIAINVLEAEWAYLNDPDRLRRLSERHLGLVAPAPTSIAPISRLALREAVVDAAGASSAATPRPDAMPPLPVVEPVSVVGSSESPATARLKALLTPVWPPRFIAASSTADRGGAQ
jgi:hypothetical protein